MPSFRGSSYLRDQTRVSPELAGRFFTTITTWKALDLAKCGGGSAKSPAHPTPTLRSTKGWCLAGESSRRLLELPGERLKHPHSWIQLCSTAQTAMISPPAPQAHSVFLRPVSHRAPGKSYQQYLHLPKAHSDPFSRCGDIIQLLNAETNTKSLPLLLSQVFFLITPKENVIIVAYAGIRKQENHLLPQQQSQGTFPVTL